MDRTGDNKPATEDALPDFAAKFALDKAPEAELIEIRERLRCQVRDESGKLGRLRALSPALRLFVAMAGLGAAALGMVFATARIDLADYPLPRMLFILAIFVLVTLVGFRLLLRPLHRPRLPYWVQGLLIAAAAGLPIAIAILPEAYHAHGLVSEVPHSLLPKAYQCLIFGTITALPFVVMGFILDRSAFFSSSRILATVLASNLIGNILLQLHCPNTDPVHLLLGHATVLLPLLALLLLIVWIRKRQ